MHSNFVNGVRPLPPSEGTLLGQPASYPPCFTLPSACGTARAQRQLQVQERALPGYQCMNRRENAMNRHRALTSTRKENGILFKDELGFCIDAQLQHQAKLHGESQQPT